MYDCGTRFTSESQEEYDWLMVHLESLGYLWRSGEKPTTHTEYFMEYKVGKKYTVVINYSARLEGIGNINGTEITVRTLMKGKCMQEITKSQYEVQIKELQDKLENLKKLKVVDDEKFAPKNMGLYAIAGDCTIRGSINGYIQSYNSFKTEEKACKVSKKIKFLLMCEQFRELHCPDFDHLRFSAYTVIASSVKGQYAIITIANYGDSLSAVYFPKDIAKKLCDLLNEGRVEL